MEMQRVVEVCEFYVRKLGTSESVKFHIQLSRGEARNLSHALWMCGETIELARADRREKAFRWLGFVQGVLWVHRIFSVEELKNHNRPDFDPPR